MNADGKPQPSGRRDFWRACRYLIPHRKIVIISIVAAIIVGAAFTSGLSTMLPILRLLISGDTLQGWIDRTIVERRMGVMLAEDTTSDLLVMQTRPDALEGLESRQTLIKPGLSGSALLAVLADGRTAHISLQSEAHLTASTVELNLPPIPSYLLMAQRIVYKLPHEPVAAVASVFGILAGLALFGNFIRFFQEYLSEKAAILATTDVRRHLYNHVLRLPLGFFSQRGTGDVTSRLTQDCGQLQEGFKNVLGRAIQQPINAAMAFILAMIVSWQLTLFIIIFAPVMFILVRKFGKRMRRASKKLLQNAATMMTQLEATLIGVRVVKASNAEGFERRKYSGIVRQIAHQQMKMSRIDAMSSPIIESLVLLMAGAVIIYAAYLVLRARTLSPAEFILVMGCLVSMGDSIQRLTKLNNSFQRANAAAGRIFETLAVPVEPQRIEQGAYRVVRPRTGGQVVLHPIEREVKFENVTFSYANANAPALDGVDLTVPKGSSVAIVGRNGSGKTTLLSLLARFFDPQEGRITIDGVDIREATLRSLRGQMSIVTQDSVIFPGSIVRNIAYGRPDTDREAIIAAAKRAFAHDFIMEKPQGYDTLIGEHGAQLSGGQKQRLSIARAIYRNSPILILDEATSQVDAESEHLIQQAIEQLMHERTTFIIAHRFSTILSADRIVVMERGKIVGQGQHDELLVKCPTYQQLYERQLVGAAESK